MPVMHNTRRQAGRTLAVFTALFATAAFRSAWPADARAVETQIKATFLCKFGNYVEWPVQQVAAAELPFGIGVVAADDVMVAELTNAARGQTVNGRPIVVRRIARGDPLTGLAIVFVARSHGGRLAETLAEVKGRPILTVTEADTGAVVGSMVNFVVVDDKVKFDIALPPAELSSLKISSRLLAVARLVTGRASS